MSRPLFQLFIFRNPARRTLRKAVAALTYDLLSYSVLLQAYGLAMLSSNPASRPSRPALLRVEKELTHREMKLQVWACFRLDAIGDGLAEQNIYRQQSSPCSLS